MTLKCKVTVKKPKLSKKKLTVYNSDKETLKVIGGKGKIKWKTSNSSIATVTSKGKVKGKRAGTCTITAKRGKYTMKCKIKVPSHYAGYSKIPDFGAVYGKTAKERSYEDEGNAVIYKAGKSYYYKYIKLLKRKGFVFYDSTEGVQVYMNDYYDVVGVLYDSGLVAVLYLNLWDTY